MMDLSFLLPIKIAQRMIHAGRIASQHHPWKLIDVEMAETNVAMCQRAGYWLASDALGLPPYPPKRLETGLVRVAYFWQGNFPQPLFLWALTNF